MILLRGYKLSTVDSTDAGGVSFRRFRLKSADVKCPCYRFLRLYCCLMAPIRALLFALLVCAPSVVTQAQFAGGGITGTVSGDSGSVMPGVRISTKDVITGQVRAVLSDSSGSYSLPGLPIGKYEITVSAPAFVTQLWTGITVTAGSQRVLNFLMRAGSSESVVHA